MLFPVAIHGKGDYVGPKCCQAGSKPTINLKWIYLTHQRSCWKKQGIQKLKMNQMKHKEATGQETDRKRDREDRRALDTGRVDE